MAWANAASLQLHPTQVSKLFVAQSCATQAKSSKGCFFIDGLDEDRGDQEEITELFKRLSSGVSNIKLCVPSRPWSLGRV